MNPEEFEQLKSTFPWSEQVYANGLVQVLDRHGREVPIFTMTRFLTMITTKLAKKPEEAQDKAA